jgi:hypothetical protein
MDSIAFNSGNSVVTLSPGVAIYLRCNDRFLKDLIAFVNPGATINFPFAGSEEINSYIEKMSQELIFDILDEIYQIAGFRAGSDDIESRILICAIAEWRYHDCIFVGAADLWGARISLLMDVLRRYVERHRAKMVVLISVEDREIEYAELIKEER